MGQSKPQPREVRLHAAYAKLTFSCTPTDQDIRREQLFKRLVLHHLLQHNMYTAFDWVNLKEQQTCTYNFLQAYAKQLWPGEKARRLHLANPALKPRSTRSFVGTIDGHWGVKRNGAKWNQDQKMAQADAQSESGGEVQAGFSLDTLEGNMALSRVGKAFAKYVDVLLEPGLEHAVPEVAEWLVEGILSTEYGGEIPPAMAVGDTMVKMEGGDVTVKMEEESD